MQKIIFLDFDGTLWTFEKIPSSALKAIELARKNGHKIYINTGRTRCEIPQFLLDMNLDGHCQRFRLFFRRKQNDIYE